MNAMNSMTVFRDERFGEIRTATINGEPWFVGKDVADTLGYSNASKAVIDHVDEEDKAFVMMEVPGSRNGNLVKTAVINESGLYSLILSSKLPSAKEFKRWVTSTILPAIRKTGGYIAGEEKMDDDRLMAQALLVASRKLDERSAQLRAAQAKIEELAPKAAYCDAVADRGENLSFRDTAKLFGVPPQKFIAILLEKRYIFHNAENVLMPYADHQKRGQFVVCMVDGATRPRVQTKITPTGQQAIWRMLAREGFV